MATSTRAESLGTAFKCSMVSGQLCGSSRLTDRPCLLLASKHKHVNAWEPRKIPQRAEPDGSGSNEIGQGVKVPSEGRAPKIDPEP